MQPSAKYSNRQDARLDPIRLVAHEALHLIGKGDFSVGGQRTYGPILPVKYGEGRNGFSSTASTASAYACFITKNGPSC